MRIIFINFSEERKMVQAARKYYRIVMGRELRSRFLPDQKLSLIIPDAR